MEELSTVRIKKIVLDNFKSVEHGELVFNCGKTFVPANTKSDILGLYGQNGSGKTALIEALRILKYAMMGYKIFPAYAECINVNSNSSDLEFWFDMQWPDGTCSDVVYKFSIKAVPNPLSEEELATRPKFVFKQKVVIIAESVSYRVLKPKKSNMKTLIRINAEDTSYRLTPSMKNLFTDAAWKNILPELQLNRRIAERESRSAIFCSVREIGNIGNINTLEYKILLELQIFATVYLAVLDTKSYGIIQTQLLPTIYDNRGVSYNSCPEGFLVEESRVNYFKKDVSYISNVVSTIVPTMTLTVQSLGKQTKNDQEYLLEDIICTRSDESGKTTSVPLKYESDGVRRIISFILCFITAFNSKSFTLAIDEIDSGIFEYLLGELLQAFEESGKGQLIFTSHNLRPLEVINKDSIYFTTTNPKNRYVQMKNVHSTNNLRSMYFREILTNSAQNEDLYSGTKRYRIVNEMRRVGEQFEKDMKEAYEEKTENDNNHS